MKASHRKIIIRILLFYTLTSAVWIFASDTILFIVAPNAAAARSVSIYKGLGFVAITASLIGGLLYRELKKLEKAYAALDESEKRFRLLYQDVPIGFHSLDREGRILKVNRLWCQSLGYSQEEVVGKTFLDFVAPVSRDRFQHAFEEILQHGLTNLETEMELRHANGSTILAAVNGRVVEHPEPGGPFCYCIIQNVTEQRSLAEETRQQREEYRQILDTVPGCIYYLDPQQNIIRVNQSVALRFNSTPDKLVGKSLKSLIPQYADLIGQGFDSVLEGGKPILGVKHRVIQKDGRQTWISIDRLPYPGNNGKPVGVLTYISDVTDQVRREQDLETLIKISASLRGIDRQSDIFQAVVQGILDNLQVEGVSLSLWSQPYEDLTIVNAAGRWQVLKGQAIRNRNCMSYRAAETSRAHLTQQVSETDSIDGIPYPDDLRSAGAVPLIAERNSLGALWVGSRNPIPEEDFRLLQPIADIAAAALNRSLLNEQTQLRLRRVNALHSIDMAISSSFDLHVTLNTLLGQAVSMLGMDAAVILIYNPDNQILSYAAGLGFSGTAIQKTRLRIGESQAGLVALKRELSFIPDLHQIKDTSFEQFFRSGEDFTAYVAAPLVGKGQVKGVLEVFHRNHFTPEPEWMDFFEMLAAQAAIAIDNAQLFENIQRTNSELRQAYDSLILGWSRGLELRDAESQGHANRLVDHTLKLARRMEYPEERMLDLRRGVLLHDIGKMGIPDSILLKPGPLTEEEWQVMHMHPVYAYEMLSKIGELKSAMDVPYCHHEHWDGSGYPRGLKGEEIPLAARLFSVVDIWDALTNDRPYRKAWEKTRVVEYLQENAGKTLDPSAVSEFVTMLKEDGEI